MYRPVLPNGQLECERCEHTDRGGELYDDGAELLAFVPYHSLEALLTDAAYEAGDLSVT